MTLEILWCSRKTSDYIVGPKAALDTDVSWCVTDDRYFMAVELNKIVKEGRNN